MKSFKPSEIKLVISIGELWRGFELSTNTNSAAGTFSTIVLRSARKEHAGQARYVFRQPPTGFGGAEMPGAPA